VRPFAPWKSSTQTDHVIAPVPRALRAISSRSPVSISSLLVQSSVPKLAKRSFNRCERLNPSRALTTALCSVFAPVKAHGISQSLFRNIIGGLYGIQNSACSESGEARRFSAPKGFTTLNPPQSCQPLSSAENTTPHPNAIAAARIVGSQKIIIPAGKGSYSC